MSPALPVDGDPGDPGDPGDFGEEGPFIPAEARPAVVEDLGRAAWQVAEALLHLENPPT
ncbi:hypothetical protein ACTG9Q_28965 [Actinokineospora sp. 24-640]